MLGQTILRRAAVLPARAPATAPAIQRRDDFDREPARPARDPAAIAPAETSRAATSPAAPPTPLTPLARMGAL